VKGGELCHIVIIERILKKQKISFLKRNAAQIVVKDRKWIVIAADAIITADTIITAGAIIIADVVITAGAAA